VFFELGIRTALNKAVSMVVDDVTPKVPFDTAVLNHHVYASRMEAFVVKREIPKLAAHIEKSASLSGGQNSMWKYFGLHTTASLPPAETGINAQVARLASEMEAMRKQMSMTPATATKIAAPEPLFGQDAKGTIVTLQNLWKQLLHAVGRTSPFTRNYLQDLHPTSLANGVLTIGYDAEFGPQVALVDNAKTHELLHAKLAELGIRVRSVKFTKVGDGEE
jgi:hypothetical protein